MLRISDEAYLTKVFTQRDLADFAALVGLPVPNAIVPPTLLLAAVSATIGTRLLGSGMALESMRAEFRLPVLAGDEVTVAVKVAAIEDSKRGARSRVEWVVYRRDGRPAIDGTVIAQYWPAEAMVEYA